MKSLGSAIAELQIRHGMEPPDPRSPEELERDRVVERREFSVEQLEDMLEQLPGDDFENPRPRLLAELERARVRRDVQSTRPPGCWCLGLGGLGRVWLPDDETPVPGWRAWCRCDVGQAKKAEFLRRKTALENVRIQRVYDAMWGSVPEAFRGLSLESLAGLGETPRTLAWRVQTLLEDRDRWLYLWGPTGRAKTGAAIGALARLVDGGQRHGLFVEVRDLLGHLRTRYADVHAFAESPDRRWESLVETEVLVLDDLGAERATDWTIETLGQLVAIRHRRMLRTIVTSNLNLVDLGEHMGDARTSSRIRERCGSDGVIDCNALPNLRMGAPG